MQRVLPVVFEIDSESSIFEQEVFWKKPDKQGQDVQEEIEQVPQFVIEDDDDEAGESAHPAASSSHVSAVKPMQVKTVPSLAERLFSCLIDLLFCCGFTLPAKLQVDHYKINYIIWRVLLYCSIRRSAN